MKLHIDKEWLKRKIEEDGEEGEIGAGFEMFPLPAPVLDPNALEAARRAVGTIPGAALWTRVEEAIRAYLTALGTQPVPVAVTDAMVHAYKHSFGEYMDKSALGHITPPTPDVGFHATKYALGVALAPATQAAPMVEVPREPTEAMLNAVSGMSVSGPYLGSNEARDIWDVMLATVNQAVPDTTDEDKWTPEQHAAAISYLTGNPSR
ncbi:MAG: hypothetical protein E5W00_12960 [Mesorhizobium sp.]|nr:MAG: hypothetical protein E5W00_12960 [Mesorhizobium sp.]